MHDSQRAAEDRALPGNLTAPAIGRRRSRAPASPSAARSQTRPGVDGTGRSAGRRQSILERRPLRPPREGPVSSAAAARLARLWQLKQRRWKALQDHLDRSELDWHCRAAGGKSPITGRHRGRTSKEGASGPRWKHLDDQVPPGKRNELRAAVDIHAVERVSGGGSMPIISRLRPPRQAALFRSALYPCAAAAEAYPLFPARFESRSPSIKRMSSHFSSKIVIERKTGKNSGLEEARPESPPSARS
jgi:hypothetical protein